MPRRPGSIDVNQIDFQEAVSQNVIFSGSVKLANLGPKGNTLIIDSDGQVSGSDFITVDSTNNRIGVFTRTPQEAFHIHGNNATLRLGNGTNSGEHSVKLELSEQADGSGDMNYGFSVGYNGTSNDFEVRKYQNSTSGTNVLTINRSSNLATFSGDLKVAGDDPRIKIDGDVDSHPGLEFYENGTRKWIIFNNYGDDSLDFKTNSNTRMSIEQGGNVGIGTQSPATVLHINGALTLTEKSSDPSNPSEGESVLWMSDGTGTGDDGDILIKITAGGVTKTVTLVDFSAS